MESSFHDGWPCQTTLVAECSSQMEEKHPAMEYQVQRVYIPITWWVWNLLKRLILKLPPAAAVSSPASWDERIKFVILK